LPSKDQLGPTIASHVGAFCVISPEASGNAGASAGGDSFFAGDADAAEGSGIAADVEGAALKTG
jgi:hypothetical protein